MIPKVLLNDICENKIDTLPSQYTGQIEYIDISSIDNTRKIISGTQILDAKTAPSRARQLVKCGDILVSTVRPNLNGVAFIQKESNLPLVASTGHCVLRCNDRADSHYIFHFCQSPFFIRSMTTQAMGAAYPAVNSSIIKNCPFPLYSIEEQRHIAAMFDKISELISLRKKQLDKLDELVKARFVEMFGDPVHNTRRLPLEPLAKLGSLDRGRSKHRPRNDPDLLGGPYPLIQTGEITNSGLYITSYKNTYSELGLKQSKMWDKGTLCITIAANIAQTAILGFDACFPDSVVGFTSNGKASAIYLHYWFGFFQKILEEQAPQVAQKNINLQILSELEVIVPTQEMQSKFIGFVEQVEKSKSLIWQSLTRLETLKKSLMQKYFGLPQSACG